MNNKNNYKNYPILMDYYAKKYKIKKHIVLNNHNIMEVLVEIKKIVIKMN